MTEAEWQAATDPIPMLDFLRGRANDRLPVLADALMDAGCDNAPILNHCRGDGPHVRGCWVSISTLGSVGFRYNKQTMRPMPMVWTLLGCSFKGAIGCANGLR